jgi:hypothetical protein
MSAVPLCVVSSYSVCPVLLQNLGKLLLDEECSQMRQLPDTSDAKDSQLHQRPSHDTGVGVFGLVTELGLTFLHMH